MCAPGATKIWLVVEQIKKKNINTSQRQEKSTGSYRYE